MWARVEDNNFVTPLVESNIQCESAASLFFIHVKSG